MQDVHEASLRLQISMNYGRKSVSIPPLAFARQVILRIFRRKLTFLMSEISRGILAVVDFV